MDLKKVFDQTVRELKREVNKKVLKVPEIEVKILEATSNEPWGPHGTIMGDIAQATRNHNDYQMIMTVLYKRLNDTGRNWRHVYKALTVLEYLVANGSERVIDELQEHTYQIQTLCEFQYLEQSGKDQGINVRKKAQTLVALIKDKDKIREVRSKAAANRDKYRGVSSTGMTHRSSSYSSTGGGYGDRDDDRYGGSRGGRDEYDYSGRGGGRDADRYRDDDPYGGGRERSRNSSYDGRDASKERDAYGSKGNDSYSSKGGDRYEKHESGSVSDRDRDRVYDDDDSYSSRNGKSKGGSTPPPAYEEAVQRPASDEDSNDSRRAAAPVAKTQTSKVEAPVSAAPETVSQPSAGGSYVANQTADDDFDDFDPRGSGFSASASAPSQPTENFFPESTTNLFPEPAPAPIAQAPPPPPPPAVQKSLGGLEDLFGDSFIPAPAPVSAPAPAFVPAAASTPANNLSNHQVQTNDLFGDSFSATASTASDGFEVSAFQATPGPSPFQTASSTAPAASDPFGNSSFHLAPPPPPPVAYQPPPAPPSNFGGNSMHGFGAPGVSNGTGTNGATFGQSQTPFDTAAHNTGFSQTSGLGYGNNQGFPRQQSFSGMPQASSGNQSPYGVQQNMGGLHRSASAPHELHQPQPQPPRPQQPARKEFGPVKSAIWGDTLSMGLVDLNIAGPKVNPLNDLGIQLTDPTLKNELWGADNPKQAQKKPTSSSGMGQPMGAAMGKAMGSGSGLGRAGASGLPPPMPAPSTMGPGMGVGMRPQMGGGMNFNMGMGLNPNMGISPGMGMGMGVGMGPQMGIGMNQMGQNFQMGVGGYPNQQHQFGYR